MEDYHKGFDQNEAKSSLLLDAVQVYGPCERCGSIEVTRIVPFGDSMWNLLNKLKRLGFPPGYSPLCENCYKDYRKEKKNG